MPKIDVNYKFVNMSCGDVTPIVLAARQGHKEALFMMMMDGRVDLEVKDPHNGRDLEQVVKQRKAATKEEIVTVLRLVKQMVKSRTKTDCSCQFSVNLFKSGDESNEMSSNYGALLQSLANQGK